MEADDNDDMEEGEEVRPDYLGKHPGKFDGDPWGRQPGESVPAYAAFEVYLILGSQRSCSKTAREVKKSNTLIERWSRRWAWVRRSEMYDTEQHRLWLGELAMHRKEAAKRHIHQSVQLQQAAMRAFKAKFGENFERIDADSLKNGDLLRFIIESVKMERIALGEPGEINELQHTSGAADDDRKPLTPLTYASRIDEALALLETARARAISGPARDSD